MAVDSVQTNTVVDSSGNSYTSSVSNDQLSNEDFLQLMLEELKMQDPTKPMDSQQMLDSQMQMSSIQTNTATIEAMQSLQASFAQTALASASNVIGKLIENGDMSDSGVEKQFKVNSVESIDGDLYVTAYEIIGYDEESQSLLYSTEKSTLLYDSITRIQDGI